MDVRQKLEISRYVCVGWDKSGVAVKVAKTHEWRQEPRGIVAPFRVKKERATKESQRVRCARHKTFVHVRKWATCSLMRDQWHPIFKTCNYDADALLDSYMIYFTNANTVLVAGARLNQLVLLMWKSLLS